MSSDSANAYDEKYKCSNINGNKVSLLIISVICSLQNCKIKVKARWYTFRASCAIKTPMRKTHVSYLF